MAGGENEAVPVEPAGLRRIEGQTIAKQIGPDLGGTEGEPEVTGTARVHCVNGETAGLGCGCGENVVVDGHGFSGFWFDSLERNWKTQESVDRAHRANLLFILHRIFPFLAGLPIPAREEVRRQGAPILSETEPW